MLHLFKILWGSMPPDPPSLGRLWRSQFPRCAYSTPSKSHATPLYVSLRTTYWSRVSHSEIGGSQSTQSPAGTRRFCTGSNWEIKGNVGLPKLKTQPWYWRHSSKCNFGIPYLMACYVIFQKRVRVFHRVSNARNMKPRGRILLFSSVWKPDETRSTSFWDYFSNKEN